MTIPHSQLSPQPAPLSTSKAQRRTIQLGSIPVQVFCQAGSYCLSQSNGTAIIGKAEYSIRQFLNSKGFKALLGADHASGISVEPIAVEGHNKAISINPLSFHVASLYWHHWSGKGNDLALVLCQALIRYSLRDLADNAFGIRRSSDEKQQQLANDLAQPSLPVVTSGPALQSELRAATQGLVCLSQQNAQLMIQNAQLAAEAAALRSRATYRSEQISFNLAKAEFISASGQICCFPSVVAEKIADILQLRSGMDGWNWIVAHPEIIGQPSEWKTFSRTLSIPVWPRTAINELQKLAYTEAENTGCASYLNQATPQP